MRSVFIAWAVSGGVILLLAGLLGKYTRQSWLGILIDERGRYSLTRLQIVGWTIVVLSLIAGSFFGRWVGEANGGALDFTIPDELLLVMGISVGSAAIATAEKNTKDHSRPDFVAASDSNDRPRLAQVFLYEEGLMADEAIDVGKFQNFVITAVLFIAYIVLAVDTISDLKSINNLTALPAFSGTFVTLLGISHAGYLAGKLPNPAGTPQGLTVGLRERKAVPATLGTPPVVAVAAPTYQPRNPV